MAIATSTNYYNSAIVGQPMAGADIDVHDRHITPHYAIGFGFQRADGNMFRYVQYGAAVVAGALVGNVATNTNLASTNALVVLSSTALAIAGELLKPGMAGSRFVEITLATVANDQFAGGYLVTTKDTGIGYTYRIKGNSATGYPAATTSFQMELYEKIKVAMDNTTDIAIAAPKYANLAANTFVQGTAANIVGVAMAAASTDNYGWVCTKGRVGAIGTGDTGIGNVAALSLTTGCYEQYVTTTSLAFQHLGTIAVACAGSNQLGIIDIKLE